MTSQPLYYRLCNFCLSNTVEDQRYFLLYCDLYNDIRANIFRDVFTQTDFSVSSEENNLSSLLNDYSRICCKFIVKAYLHRRSILYY